MSFDIYQLLILLLFEIFNSVFGFACQVLVYKKLLIIVNCWSFQASELQTTMMETMEAVELEKQKHNNTRMEALTRLMKLEVFCYSFLNTCLTFISMVIWLIIVVLKIFFKFISTLLSVIWLHIISSSLSLWLSSSLIMYNVLLSPSCNFLFVQHANFLCT